jgi:hypothetical protein
MWWAGAMEPGGGGGGEGLVLLHFFENSEMFPFWNKNALFGL